MVIVIGSINLDLITTVDRLPHAGETVSGDRFSTAPGGKGANQALAAARAGSEVRMIGSVGSDAFAEEALTLLRAGGVDLSGVHVSHAATGVALILVGADGENMIAIAPGANAAVLPGGVGKAMMEKGDVVLLQHEIPISTVEAALRAARKAGAVSILNTAPFRADAVSLLTEADIVVANETEFENYAGALGLTGADRVGKMRSFAGTTGRTIVVTLGGEGAVAASPGAELSVPSIPITPVDTVGAGDTFCGYLGAGLAEGAGLNAALKLAAVAGALACLKPGAQPAIPLRSDVLEALKAAG